MVQVDLDTADINNIELESNVVRVKDHSVSTSLHYRPTLNRCPITGRPGTQSLLEKLRVLNTRGSVTTVVAEKEKFAKASLALNCKKGHQGIVSEYVEKYEQKQLPSQPVPEQVSSMTAEAQKSRPLLEEQHGNSTKGEVKRVKHVKNQQKKSFLTWLLLLRVSIFGVVMALPLLQL